MSGLKENISFLKNFVQKRETYIRFSPLWTAIMWLMYILYYFFWIKLENNMFIFFFIWTIWIIIVTILSILNSKNKWEELFPKSIKNIIINLIFIWISYITISIMLFPTILSIYIKPLSLIFYWLLIIVSRFSIPKCIKYFWFICFVFWILSLLLLDNYINEILLLILWFGHIIISILLKINNHKNGKNK